MALVPCSGVDPYAGSQAPVLNPNRINEALVGALPGAEAALHADLRYYNESANCQTATPLSSRWMNNITKAFRYLMDAGGICEPTNGDATWLYRAVQGAIGASLTFAQLKTGLVGDNDKVVRGDTLFPFLNLVGDRNTCVGEDAGGAGAQDDEVALGYQAGEGNTFNGAVSIGSQARKDTTAAGVGIGFQSGMNSSGDITAVGSFSARDNQGSGVTAIGLNAAANNSGNSVTAVGARAGEHNTGDTLTAVGHSAGDNNTGLVVTALGRNAGESNSGSEATLLGANAGDHNTGIRATAVGRGAGGSNIGPEATVIGAGAGRANSGDRLTAVGTYAGGLNSEGDDVTSVGYNAGHTNVGNQNTFLGSGARRNFSAGAAVNATVTANLSTFTVTSTASIGTAGQRRVVQLTGAPAPAPYSSGDFIAVEVVNGTTLLLIDGVFTSAGTTVQVAPNSLAAVNNSTAVGFGALAENSNEVKLGNASIAMVRSSGDATFNTILTASDERLKANILPLQDVISKLRQMEGKSFTWNENERNGRRIGENDIGLIAQEVEKVFPEAVIKDGDYLSVKYLAIVAPLVSAVVALADRVEQLEAKQ